MQMRYLLGLLAVALLVGLSAIYLLLYFFAPASVVTDHSWPAAISTIWLSVVPNLLASLIAFAAVYFFLERRGILSTPNSIGMSLAHLRGFHIAHRDVDWGEVFRSAHALEVGVFYYRTLPTTYFDDLVQFFREGGSLTLIVADMRDENLLANVGRHFFGGMTANELKDKVAECIAIYQRAFQAAASTKARFEVRLFKGVFHYTYTVADRHTLYLSPYAQFEGTPQLMSPVTVIDLHSDQELHRYWEDQLNGFKEGSDLFVPAHSRPPIVPEG